MPRCIDIPCDILAASYRAGQTTNTLARRHGCSPTTIAKRLRGCGVTLRDARFPAIGVAEAQLRQLYTEERLPLSAIAARLGVSISTIGNKRRAYGIPIRPRRACIESTSTNGSRPA
jgi:transcriptional regulator of aromatic amino acid metabolism